jgi:hypothetical protein
MKVLARGEVGRREDEREEERGEVETISDKLKAIGA